MNLITHIRLLWRRRRGPAPDQVAADAASHGPRPENFAGRWPDANAVLAWRLSAAAVSVPQKPENTATIGKQETP